MSYTATAPIIKKGPFGSAGGSVKDMDPTDITRIVKITIHHNEVIHALRVYFERNGTTGCTSRWGGDGGNLTEINLKTNEYITCVKGYFNDDYNGHEVIMSLKLETNLGIYGPYGEEKGQFFELPAIEGQIIGFHARYAKYVNAVGVYVQATGPIMKKGPFGGDGGIVKDMDPTDITRIVKITIYHGNVIDSLIVYFERSGTTQCTERWGGDGGNMSEINFNSNEYITHVEGYFIDNYQGHKVVASLTLKTNLAVYGPYGKEKGQSFEFPAHNGKIIGFYAHYEKYVNAIGVYVQATGPIIKKEPFGGDGEQEKYMDPTSITRIAKITIHHDKVIDSLTVYFERNGTTECTDRWGGDGGNMTEINLATNEYITYVKGYINHDYNGQEVVMALTLETNLAIYGPYGTEEGESFELPAYHGKIIGFHARHGMYVNAVGVYVQATSPIIKKGPFGDPHGIVKDMDPMGITRIVEIAIYHSDVIDALMVCFERNGITQCTDRWGGDGGTKTEIKLITDEYVTFVKGYINDDYNGQKVVMALTLETNLAVYGPYGTEEGESFELPAYHGKIIAFHARYEKYVNAVGVYVQSIAPIIKKGPFGSTGLSVEDMDPTDITRIVKITIHHSEVIDALRVYFECNGTTDCTSRWGGDGGNVTEIDLKENEYITYVKGYFNDNYNGHEVVMSLVLQTNLDVYGPYGTETGESFEISTLRGQIIGFHALHGKYVNAIGVYVPASGPIINKGPVGSSGESVKDMNHTHITRIVKIAIRHSYVIDALTVYFERNGTTECTDRWGGNGGNVTEIDLKPDEYIKSVKGHIDNFDDDPIVSSLVLETNLAVYGPYGMEKGEFFELSIPNRKIIGFHARHGKYLNTIGVHTRPLGFIIKKGPIGAKVGVAKDMDPTDIARILKIAIHHGELIDGFIVYFERNDTSQYTERWGGWGGTKTEIKLKSNEYITCVKGYINPNYQGYEVVSSLLLETNMDVYGPYGRDIGQLFEFPALPDQIIGFHAITGYHRGIMSNCVLAIGVYIKTIFGPITTLGKIGSSGETVKYMDPIKITRIVKITIRHRYVIDAITVYFERNGTTECTDQWGGNGGNVTEIDLKKNEYITSVKGYIDNFNNNPTVSSLVLETNLGDYGPYGRERGKYFEFPAIEEGEIIGFHARFGTYVNAIGVYVKAFKRKLMLCGGSGGLPKDMDLTGLTRIVTVSIRYSINAIHALSVSFERKGTNEHTTNWGRNTGQLTEIKLKPHEHITSVRGYVGYFDDLFIVRSLEVITNLKKYGPFGKEEGTPFEFYAPGGQIIGFHGRSGAYLDAIGVYALAFKVLAKNYLGIENHHLFDSIRELLVNGKVSPADVAEDLTLKNSGNEDVDVYLQNLIDNLKKSKEEAKKNAEDMVAN